MAGLDRNMLNLIKYLAKNQIQNAKTAALACLANDKTKKNEVEVGYYTKLIKNGNTTMFELPANVQGLMTVEDMGHFLADRYYTGKVQKELFEDIITGVKVTEKLTYYGIPSAIAPWSMESREPEKQSLPSMLHINWDSRMPILISRI